MAHIKPILAMSSVGLGAALLLLTAHIQRDPFAFTSQAAQNDDALTGVHLVAPPPMLEPETIVEAPLAAEPGRSQAFRDEARAPRPRKPSATPRGVAPAEQAQPPCNPGWRELESGPTGRRVRELCPTSPTDDVPRS
ncbi:MAG TPA: hypothetical protein VM686_00850 [Polyangiaceae bacterium]|nr:hypothetical protein [Polyangiaceae bacterium]